MRFISKILVSASLAATFAYAQTLPKFQHIIVVVQENRTPDNLFGSNPTFETGVDLQTPSAGPWCLGACFDPGHRHSDWESQYQQPKQACPGTMGKGLCTAQATCNGQTGQQMPVPSCPQQTYVSGTYDNSVVAPYFDIAEKYGFANYFFQTNEGPSMPAHQFLFSGTSAPNGVVGQHYYNYFQAENTVNDSVAGCTAPPSVSVELIDPSGTEDASVYPCFTHNSLPTLLDAASPSVTWRYYANESWAIWNAPNAIYNICMPLDGSQTICTGSDYINNDILNPSQVLHDLGAVNHQECNLKQVSWVIPNGDRSDHPGLITGKQNSSTEVEGGPSWVADIINTLGNDPGQCGYWNNTAVFIVWDDWGGFYDHVAPFKVVNDGKSWGSGYVYGFRVPFLVVSAYTGTLNQNGTYSGYVSGTPGQGGKTFPYVHDFGSILAFIENNFLGSGQIGQINPGYQFADAFAPDFLARPLHVPLADFFTLTLPRLFQAITLPAGAPSATDFINYNGPILDPDNDVIDND